MPEKTVIVHEKSDLIGRLKLEIKAQKEKGSVMDFTSWKNETGVLITLQEAEEILNFLM